MPAYPDHLVERVTLRDGAPVTIRPIRSEDSAIEQEFVRRLSDEARYFRFMDTLRELSPGMLRHFTEIDYSRHLALVAVDDPGGALRGVARYVADPNLQRAEFAIVVADDWQRRGLGERLMKSLIAAARATGLRVLFGEVLAGNHKMLGLMAKLGFTVKFSEQNPRVLLAETAI